MNAPRLLSPAQAEDTLAEMFSRAATCALSVSEERAFQDKWLSLGDINLFVSANGAKSKGSIGHIRRGAFEWLLPKLQNTRNEALDIFSKEDKPQVDRALDEIASITARAGLVHPPFDSAAIEEMPFRRSTTVVCDTSGVLHGGLDFVARFLHPAARVKMPAITHMEIVNQADRFLKIRRKRNPKSSHRIRELLEHFHSQGGQRALLRIELHEDIEIERTYLLGDPLRSAFTQDSDRDMRDLNLSTPLRSHADRLILESARHHQAQSGPAHAVRLLTSDQGLARMALAEGVNPLYFFPVRAREIFGKRLTGQVFHPFSGHIHAVSLTALLWELTTAFGAARLQWEDGSAFKTSAIGESLAWQPCHAEQDLLWCECAPATKRHIETAANADASRADAETTPESVQPSVGAQRASLSDGDGKSMLRFSVGRMFNLVCALDDQQRLNREQAQEIIGGKGDEYSRFLLSAHLVDWKDGIWKAGEGIQFFAAALRNERIKDVREVLLKVPSFAHFSEHLRHLQIGQALDKADLAHRALPVYCQLGEIVLLCASVGNAVYSTPTVPSVEKFSEIALNRLGALEREASGLAATGEWLESLIRDEGIHPEVARRLLDEASERGLLRRYTEGSTTQLRHGDRKLRRLRLRNGMPTVEIVHLYRGDYLIPGKASVSLRIEEAKP